ncbi:hypothetical protein [Hahella sp. HN01]|uniref:hypothetical protein n=1 Tax=Hahella sp. HN01 TaxID=2847262 RepID=UPI001C1EB2C2|nr:hypothetical protein [Hahella sp. HN01]MBU6955082.1 hypothetical protein [Hahella sp. HN01]
MANELFEKWLLSLFDHDPAMGDWRWEVEPINIDPTLAPDFIVLLNHRWSELLNRYDDWQLGTGIEYLYNNSFSDFAFDLRDAPAPLDARIAAIQSIKYMYSDCFAIRCEAALGHKSETASELNCCCYMLWDVTPLSYCEGNPDKEALYSALAEVMEFALGLSNPACIESALHGLGHMTPYYPKARQIIQQYIDRGVKKASSEMDKLLLHYAVAAKEDGIQ